MIDDLPSVVWPWNQLGPFVISNGPDAHQFVQHLVRAKYGDDAEHRITGIELDGDEGTISVDVRQPPQAQMVDISLVPVKLP